MKEKLVIGSDNKITKSGTSNTLGRKNDNDKTRTDLIPVDAMMKVAEVLTMGAVKYDDRNWEKGIKFGRVYGALLRHLWAWWCGRDFDIESKRLHLAHVATNALFLLHYALDDRYSEFDDRPGGESDTR